MIAWIVAAVGWAAAGTFFGLWRGAEAAKGFITNLRVYGGPNPIPKAQVWVEEEAEDRVEKAGRIVTGQSPDQPQFDERTIEQGVEYLLAEARRQGVAMTAAEAREDAIAMLMADGPEIE